MGITKKISMHIRRLTIIAQIFLCGLKEIALTATEIQGKTKQL